MSNSNKKLFVERLPSKEYVVREQGVKAPVAKARTQEKAIEKAEKLNPTELLVERVRITDVGGRDKWRLP